jgi:protein-tyrosine phosphatase
VWSWTLNWNEIRPDVIIGSCPMKPADIAAIQTASGASALLSLQHQECLDRLGIDYRRHAEQGHRLGLIMARSPMRDFDPSDQRLHLPEAVRALHELLRGGRRVYVHCTAGINRSSLVVLAYFVLVETQSEDVAFATIRRRRPEAAPYWEALRDCRRDLLEQHRDAIRARAQCLDLQRLYPDMQSVIRQAEQEIIRDALTQSWDQQS